jgi:hypothetical protein
LIFALCVAALLGCSLAFHILFVNRSGMGVTLHLVDGNADPDRPMSLNVAAGKSRLFAWGETEEDAVLRLSVQRCDYVFRLPDPPDGRWDDWRMRVRLERDLTLTVVNPFPGILELPKSVDIWKTHGVTVRPTSRTCR